MFYVLLLLGLKVIRSKLNAIIFYFNQFTFLIVDLQLKRLIKRQNVGNGPIGAGLGPGNGINGGVMRQSGLLGDSGVRVGPNGFTQNFNSIGPNGGFHSSQFFQSNDGSVSITSNNIGNGFGDGNVHITNTNFVPSKSLSGGSIVINN